MRSARKIADRGLGAVGGVVTTVASTAREVGIRALSAALERVVGSRGGTSQGANGYDPAARVRPTDTGTATGTEIEIDEPPAWTPEDIPPAPPVEEHVDEETVLVAEFAEPGAEDGPGPELEVEEPWRGYEKMKARDIVDRLQQATPAVVAAVRLYESTHKNRATVLAAAERALRTA